MYFKILISYLVLAGCLERSGFSQTPLSYGDAFPEVSMIHYHSGKQVILPSIGDYTLIYFRLTNEPDHRDIPYLEALNNGDHQDLKIYRVPYNYYEKYNLPGSLEDLKFRPDTSTLPVELYQNRTVFLIDRYGYLRYLGPLPSPAKFNRILERNHLDITFQLPENLEKLISLFKTENLETDTIKSQSPHQFVFVRSICEKCGDIEQLKYILETIRFFEIPLNVSFVFRKENIREVFKTIDFSTGQFRPVNALFVPDTLNANLDRMFASANPLYLFFDSTGQLISSKRGDNLFGRSFTRLLKSIAMGH